MALAIRFFETAARRSQPREFLEELHSLDRAFIMADVLRVAEMGDGGGANEEAEELTMPVRTHRKGLAFDDFLAENLNDPEFRQHFEQRRLIQEVALAVREMREAAGITQAQLAGMIGVKQPMIARVERGSDRRTPSWAVLRRVGRALGKQLVVEFVSSRRAVPLVQVDGERPRARAG